MTGSARERIISSAVICPRCGHEILPGQLWRSYPIWAQKGTPAHVACPTPGQAERAALWGRWM
jgi:hypothetical protein